MIIINLFVGGHANRILKFHNLRKQGQPLITNNADY